jgi:hypothetical protein
MFKRESRGFYNLFIIWVFVFLGLTIGLTNRALGVEIVEPKSGAIFSPGETVTVKARPSFGENLRLVSFHTNLQRVGFGPVDLIPPYEWEFKLPEEHLGVVKIFADGVPVGDPHSVSASHTSVTITVVLPPTTTVQSIGADFSGRDRTFLRIARKPNGELVALRGFSERQLYVGAIYSDGVARVIDTAPDVTYESLDEKVAIVIPPPPKGYAQVKATGPGKTEIVVRYKGYESRVTVHVKECPYIEGKTDKEGCPF